jgi:hypothetical protein
MFAFYRIKSVLSYKESESHRTNTILPMRFSIFESQELIVQYTDKSEISVVNYSGDLWDGFWIGWLDLLTPYTHISGLHSITAL